MAYWFSGIFADGDAEVMSAVLNKTSGVGRMIEQPFRGFGVKFRRELEDEFGEEQLAGIPRLCPGAASFPESPSCTFMSNVSAGTAVTPVLRFAIIKSCRKSSLTVRKAMCRFASC